MFWIVDNKLIITALTYTVLFVFKSSIACFKYVQCKD